MARGAQCDAETEIYGAERRQAGAAEVAAIVEVTAILVRRIVEATSRVGAALEAFDSIMREIPGRSVGAQRIRAASQNLSVARKEMMIAHRRLNEFVERGIVPADLRRPSADAGG